MSDEQLNNEAIESTAVEATNTEASELLPESGASKDTDVVVASEPLQAAAEPSTGSGESGNGNGNGSGNGNGKRDRDNVDDNDDDTEENATKQFKSSDDSDNATSGGDGHTGMLSGRSSVSNEEQQTATTSTVVIAESAATPEIVNTKNDDDNNKEKEELNTATSGTGGETKNPTPATGKAPTATTSGVVEENESSVAAVSEEIGTAVSSTVPANTVSSVTISADQPTVTNPRVATADKIGNDSGSTDPISTTTAANATEETIEETGVVSAMYVGRVIGKGGEMIRDLQARSGARIDVDQNVPIGQPRVITYRGTRETVEFAKYLVKMLSTDGVNESDLPLGKASQEFVIIPANSVGKVIGRGGEMIRELQSRSHAKIQIDHTGSAGLNPDEKQVTVTGTQEAVVKAKEMILLLVDNPLMDAQQSLNMLIEDKNRGGSKWGSGPPYPNLPNQGVNMQPHMVAQSQHQSISQGYGMYGQPVAPMMQHGNPMMMGEYPPQQQSSVPYGVPPMGGYPHMQQNPPGVMYMNDGRESEMLYVSKQYMGRIIGSKGVTINDLQRRSACDIQINQDVPPGKDCEITVKGTRQGIDHAKAMIQEIIEVGPSHPYAGGIENYGMRNSGGYHGAPQQQQQHQQHHHQNYHNQQPQPQYNPYQQQAQPQPIYDQSGVYAQPTYPPQVNPSGYNAPMMGVPPYVQQPMQQIPPMQQQPQAVPYQQQTPYGSASGVVGGYPQSVPQTMSITNPTAPRQHQLQPQVPPQPVQVVSQWKAATAQNGQVYYYNERTGETQWDKPLGMP